MKRIDGTDKDLSDYSGKVVLVVNVSHVATHHSMLACKSCMTPSRTGFVILGFPANDSGAQERK